MLILDRYIIKQFISTFFFSIFALCIIFLVVSLLENLDDFLDRQAGFLVIARYYLYFFPEIIKLLTPVGTLMATLFTIGKLSTRNEVTAMKSGGMSLYRLMLPLIVLSIVLSLSHLYFNGWVVPRANTQKINIEREYLKQGGSRNVIYNLYFRDAPNRNVIMQYYNAEKKKGNRAAIEYYDDSNSPRLTKRIEAGYLTWDDEKQVWNLINGIEREFSHNSIRTERFDTLAVEINLTHKQIIRLQKDPSEMVVEEFRDYIDLIRRGGKDVSKQMIEYHAIFAFPFANFIVILFGVPFASVRKRGGIALQIGAAMVISFLYMIFIKFSQTLGYSLGVDEVLAAWFANIVFLIAGLIVIFKTKT